MTDDQDRLLVVPPGGSTTGVLVLGGSSGRVEKERARLVAGANCIALTLRWFGGDGQPPGICEIPLEVFVGALDELEAAGADRFATVGVSKGAEAALGTSVVDGRVGLVVALAPTSMVWANLGAGSDGKERPQRSCWTWQGRPLPFVPYDDEWEPPPPPVSFRGQYGQAERVHADRVLDARIAVEKTHARLVLVAGTDDQVWPSDRYARELHDRRSGRDVALLIGEGSGHRCILPGERPAPRRPKMNRGGTTAADRALGERAWAEMLESLQSF